MSGRIVGSYFIRSFAFVLSWICCVPMALADLPETIARIKPSIVVVGVYKKTNSPQFMLRGTGFVVGNGKLVATNSHVVPESADLDGATLVVQGRNELGEPMLRAAQLLHRDQAHDLAVLSIDGAALPALSLKNSDSVREGQSVAFTGFPIGGALGFSPVTHRGIVSSITPIALPGGNSRAINAKLIKQLKAGAFNIFQMDATAYPGNSGSPVFDTDTGEVVGVVNMVFTKGSKEAALSHPSGISYAIPSNYLNHIMRAGGFAVEVGQ